VCFTPKGRPGNRQRVVKLLVVLVVADRRVDLIFEASDKRVAETNRPRPCASRNGTHRSNYEEKASNHSQMVVAPMPYRGFHSKMVYSDRRRTLILIGVLPSSNSSRNDRSR